MFLWFIADPNFLGLVELYIDVDIQSFTEDSKVRA